MKPLQLYFRGETTMTDKDVTKGQLKQAEGKVQETVGKATNSTEDKIAGKTKQGVGKVQEGMGHMKDDARREANKTRA
jgi:uncharacterized protein YjbJ (UPF0337 family)